MKIEIMFKDKNERERVHMYYKTENKTDSAEEEYLKEAFKMLSDSEIGFRDSGEKIVSIKKDEKKLEINIADEVIKKYM